MPQSPELTRRDILAFVYAVAWVCYGLRYQMPLFQWAFWLSVEMIGNLWSDNVTVKA
jgi:hypothetical protein